MEKVTQTGGFRTGYFGMAEFYSVELWVSYGRCNQKMVLSVNGETVLEERYLGDWAAPARFLSQKYMDFGHMATALIDRVHSRRVNEQKWNAEVRYNGALVPWGGSK